jgi:predicted hydrolase (HD superfamily)
MNAGITKEAAIGALKAHNKEQFHIHHAQTVGGVLKWFANSLGHENDAEFWEIVGLLHDIDFEEYPEEHCLKAPEMLKEIGASEELIHAVVSHGYGCPGVEAKPESEMEKVLYATDELTGLIGATALMRPSKSVQDLELKSVKKKYKSPNFAAGCSREVIEKGAEMLGWDLDDLITKTILAMRSCEVV